MKFVTKEIIATGIILPLIILFYIKLMSPNSYSINETRFNLTRAKMTPVESAIEAYHINTSQYPVELEDMVKCPAGLEDLWKGPYLREIQLYDPWERPYIYNLTNDGYELISYGADGLPGGEGYNEDIYND